MTDILLTAKPPPSFPDSKCRDLPLDFFFPVGNDKGGRSKKSGGRLRTSTKSLEVNNAKFCLGLLHNDDPCPHLDECLRFALDNKERGIWGGTTEEERRNMR